MASRLLSSQRSTACPSKFKMLKFKYVICVPQQMEPQPHALAQTLNVVLETYCEQRKVNRDVNLEEQPGKDSEIIGSLLLLQGI